MQGSSPRRQDVASAFVWLAAFSATALLAVPKGLSLFAGLMLVATLLALPDAWRDGRASAPRALHALLLMALAVVVVAVLSLWSAGARLAALDNPARVLLLPWCAWLAWTTRVRASSLWWGALAGLVIAFLLSSVQSWLGVERAGGGANPIVFANAVLILLVVAVFCRPARQSFPMQLLLALVVALAVVAVTLSGSRGVLPGLGLVLLMLFAGGAARHRWRRLALVAGVFAALFAALWTVPWLSTQFRMDSLHADVSGYAQDHVDQPISARMGLLSVAWDAFRSAPLSGVGIGGFAQRVDASGYCRDASRHFCGLEHAHNDLAQWGATMGVGGIVVLLALYGVPLVIAARHVRRSKPDLPVGAGWAAGMLVAVYLISGLTQSMFSHALTTSAYVVIVGLLLGTALAEEAPSQGGGQA
ncbi:O-antigen ligase [Pseudoxanthomonas sp. CF385]|uniref:O-antigen ligase family protein n=1 Tax=Pseudoxanthomonas sp. CF385 TaxID=1881042 RepID=UPI0008871A51|nr:O-antigen ligase family protein [Pseudoxanthomonas sp. CF385]SDQ31613.1 O-antigen ligase [Pseudoxanthomonas sp. CF385]